MKHRPRQGGITWQQVCVFALVAAIIMTAVVSQAVRDVFVAAATKSEPRRDPPSREKTAESQAGQTAEQPRPTDRHERDGTADRDAELRPVSAGGPVVAAAARQSPQQTGEAEEAKISLRAVKELYKLFRESADEERIEELTEEVDRLRRTVAALNNELQQEKERRLAAEWERADMLERRARFGFQRAAQGVSEEESRQRQGVRPADSSRRNNAGAFDDGAGRPVPAEPLQDDSEPADEPGLEPSAEAGETPSAVPTRRRRFGYLNVNPDLQLPAYGPPPGSARKRIAERQKRRRYYVDWSRRYYSRDAGLRILNEMEAGHR